MKLLLKYILCCNAEQDTDIELHLLSKEYIEKSIILFFKDEDIYCYDIIWKTNKLPCCLSDLIGQLEYEIKNKHITNCEIIINDSYITVKFNNNPFNESRIYFNIL